MRAFLFAAIVLLSGCDRASTRPGTTNPTRALPAAKLPTEPGTVQGAPALLPTGLTSFGAAVQDNALYVLGGFYGTPHEYLPEHQSRALLRLPLDGHSSWESLPGLEAGLQSAALVANAGALHRIGGMRVMARGQLQSVDEHARFVDGRWQSLPKMPAARSSHDAAVHTGRIYVVGGWKLEGNRAGTFYDDMWVYRDDSGWEQKPSPVQRRALAVASTDEHLVAIGGFDPDRRVSRLVDVYHVATETWSAGPPLPGDRNGFGVAAVGAGNRIYASGQDGIVWSWRVGDKDWTQVGELVFPRFFHRLVSPAPDKLIAVGGIGGMHRFGRTRHLETLDLAHKPQPALVLWTLPSPGPAKNRQGMFLHGDQLVLFGGNNSLGQHDFEPDNFVSDAHIIHVPSLTVRSAAPYPARRQTMQTTVVGDVGVSVGGFGHDGKVARTHAQAFSYDFTSDTWQPRPGLPVARSQFGLAAYGDELWVFGGLNYDPTRTSADQFWHLTEVLSGPNDGSAGFGDTGIKLLGPRRAFGGAFHKGRYYLVGGMRGGFELVEDCTAFEFATDKWLSVACPQHVRLNPQLVAVGDTLVLVGGSAKIGENLTEDRSIEVYDPVTDRWSKLNVELPFSPKHMMAAAYRDHLLIYSAHNDDGVIHLGLVTIGAGQ
jgi:hypothetical protein